MCRLGSLSINIKEYWHINSIYINLSIWKDITFEGSQITFRAISYSPHAWLSHHECNITIILPSHVIKHACARHYTITRDGGTHMRGIMLSRVMEARTCETLCYHAWWRHARARHYAITRDGGTHVRGIMLSRVMEARTCEALCYHAWWRHARAKHYAITRDGGTRAKHYAITRDGGTHVRGIMLSRVIKAHMYEVLEAKN